MVDQLVLLETYRSFALFINNLMVDLKNYGNENPLFQDKFKFVLHRIPHVSFMCFDANFPGISQTSPIQVFTPVNPWWAGGKHVTWEDFTIQFRVDEDLVNYQELWYWIHGLTSPVTPDEFKAFITGASEIKQKYSQIYSDGTLLTLTNVMNVNIAVNFADLMPISLSGIEFSLSDTQGVVINARAAFRYTYYVIETNAVHNDNL